MNILATKEKLLRSIQLAEDIITAKNTMSILSNILLETIDDMLQITSTDLETAIKIHVDADVKKEGSITVFAKKFADIIRELPNDDIEIHVDENKYLKIQSKNDQVKAQFKLIGIPKNDYPILPEFKKDKSIKVPQNVFKAMIRKSIFSVSKDDVQVNISGVKLELKNKKLTLVATDARRLSLISYDLDTKTEIDEVIIPQKVLSEVLKILNDEGDMEISVSEKQIYFKIDNIELFSRLIDGKFPDYQQVIPQSFKKKAFLFTIKILNAVKRVSIITTEKQSSKIILKFTKGNLEIKTNDPDIGEAKESVENIVYDYDDVFEIAFSSEFLLDALKAVDTENMIFSMNTGIGAIAVREENNDNFLCLIMPIKLSNAD
ncbi:MAG: DNA polymerase III subunit beta [bacterium]|nr:DNA polymerase III subunit beta [bacterium]